MDYAKFIDRLLRQHQKQLPFVVYALPQSQTLTAYFQKDSSLNSTSDFLDEGVIMAPFDYENSALCIPAVASEKVSVPFEKETFPWETTMLADENEHKKAYEELVSKTINFLRNKKVSKIVLSRKKEVVLRKLDLETMLSRLLSLYPGAFRYVWFHPQTGLWCGASPEVLLQIEGSSFNTMALAATQKYDGKNPPQWSEKEIEEQQFVTEAITNSLQKVTSVLRVSKPHNQRAGALVHLRTDIVGMLKNGKATLQTIVSALHPTPAVCGTPQKQAKEFILENENHDREFYTGFVGPICNEAQASQLFVNLRCMKIEGKTAHLFAGGGITLGSEPTAEWLETQNKLQTMLQVLQPML